MKDINDTEFEEGKNYEDYDHEIELVESDAISGNWNNRSVKYYKPKFTDQDFLYGWYNTKKNSWLRLVLHECDNSTLAIQQRLREGRKFINCASKYDQRKFFEDNLFWFVVSTKEMSIGQANEKHRKTSRSLLLQDSVTFTQTQLVYSSLDPNNFLEWREVIMAKSSLKIFNLFDINIKGLYEYMVEREYLQFLRFNV